MRKLIFPTARGRRVAIGVLTTLLLALVAAPGPAAGRPRAHITRLGPPPVPCGTACNGSVSASGQIRLAQSPFVHLSISPHYVAIGQVITMKVTFSGPAGFCLPARGATCGPAAGQTPLAVLDEELVPVSCSNPDPNRPANYNAINDWPTTQCYEVTPQSAAAWIPPEGLGYQVVDAYLGPTSEQFATSEDWFTVVPDRYEVTGKVTLGCSAGCSASGEPLASVPVLVRGKQSFGATTDENGSYSVFVPSGHYSVSARVPGFTFAPSTRSISVPAPAFNVDFKGCTSPGLATVASASSASAAASGVKLYAESCANLVNLDFNPASRTWTVGWKILIPKCTYHGTGSVDTPDRGMLPFRHRPVPSQPGDRITQEASGLDILVTEDRELVLELHVSRSGTGGTVDIGSLTYPSLTAAGAETCHSRAETLELGPRP